MEMLAIEQQVERLGRALAKQGLLMGTAESCTGGLIASLLTDLSGSSAWFKGAVVAYANEVKQDVLGVPEEALAQHGAVSEPVVEAMISGLCRALDVDAGLAVSGIAGPTGGSPEKPVGTVCFAWMLSGNLRVETRHFQGQRAAIKLQTARHAIQGLADMLEEQA